MNLLDSEEVLTYELDLLNKPGPALSDYYIL